MGPRAPQARGRLSVLLTAVYPTAATSLKLIMTEAKRLGWRQREGGRVDDAHLWACLLQKQQPRSDEGRGLDLSQDKAEGMGYPGGSVVKNLPAHAGDAGSIPGSGRSPGGRNGNSLQYSRLGNPMNRGGWWATVHGVARVGHDSTTTERRPRVATCTPKSVQLKGYSEKAGRTLQLSFCCNS